MIEYTYNDGLQNGGRRPHLFLVRGDEWMEFDGETVKGWVLVVTRDYSKNGKWSSTTYLLGIPDAVKAVEMLSPLHQTWGDRLKSWAEAAAEMGVPEVVARAIVGKAYPRTAGRLDQIEMFE